MVMEAKVMAKTMCMVKWRESTAHVTFASVRTGMVWQVVLAEVVVIAIKTVFYVSLLKYDIITCIVIVFIEAKA